jgi:hypothetical protein
LWFLSKYFDNFTYVFTTTFSVKHRSEYSKIPRSRIATFDVFAVGMERHHVSAMLEFDVTGSRKHLQELRRNGTSISFNGWLIKTIADVLLQHREATAYRSGRKRLVLFDDINISVIVEKKSGSNRVPIPLVVVKASEKAPSRSLWR